MKDKDKNNLPDDENFDDEYYNDNDEYLNDDEYYDDEEYYDDDNEYYDDDEYQDYEEDDYEEGSIIDNDNEEEPQEIDEETEESPVDEDISQEEDDHQETSNPYDELSDDKSSKLKKDAKFSFFKSKDESNQDTSSQPKKKAKKGKSPAHYIWFVFKKLVSLVVTTIISIFLILVITGTVCVVAFVLYVLSFMDTTTDVSLMDYEMSYASYIYTVDKDGTEDLVYKVKSSNGEQRIPVTIDDIPQDVRNAFVYTEDERFYAHDGVDLKRTLGAFVNIFTNIYGSEQGGSTITQQLIKNITGEDDVSSQRKIREIFRAMQLEKKYPKDKILESYLNCIYFGRVDGNNLNGIEAASIAYFGKTTKELSIAEAACLASIPKDPFKYNPLNNPEENATRREYVLSKMFENGVISPEQYEDALEEKLIFTNSEEFSKLNPDFKLFDDTEEEEEIEYDEDGNPIKKVTPWYVDAAIYEVRDWIAETEGVDKETALSIFNKGGYTLYLTIDLDMQAYVDESYMNRDNFLTYSKNPQGERVQSSFVAMDYDGNVLAMSGGIGEKTDNLGFNRAVQSERQVGSTMKPVASYGCALYNDKITWSTIFKDSGITVDGQAWPKNYTTSGDSLNWSRSPTYVYDALRRSLNTIPAKICDELGLETVFAYSTEKLGMDLLAPEDAPNGTGDMTYSALAVGGLYKGISIENLVNAFMPYGNGGYYNKAHVISRIENSATGEIILDNSTGKHQVIDEETAYVMNKLLRQVVKSGTGTAANLSNKTVCAKTGTTSDFNDITFVGLTEDFVSGIWVGYDTPYSLSPSLSSAQIWKNVIGGYANKLDTGAEYPECDTVIEARFCTSTGKIANSRCPKSSDVGYYKSSNAEYCGTH
ncbi:MAG: transglycosylase domain-containing protein [Oscillospiraceae bacterium]